MVDPEWLLRQVILYNPYPEFCLFYLNNLKEAFSSSTLSRTSKMENIIKAGEFRGIKVLSEILKSHIKNLNICITGLYAIYVITSNYGKRLNPHLTQYQVSFSIDLNKEYASNALDSAIRSMKEFENNESIQIYGFCILWHINKSKYQSFNQVLLLLDKTVLLKAHAQLIAEKEGVLEVILDGLKVSTKNTDAYVKGCEILRNEKFKCIKQPDNVNLYFSFFT